VFEYSISQEGGEVASPDWRPLYLFNLYRLTVALVFTGSVTAQVAPSFLGEFDRSLFLFTGWTYLGFAILSILVVQRRWIPFQIQVIVQILLDIALTTLLMHASGGVNSGLGVLLVVVVAGGSLLTEGRTAFFFAAIASLSVLIHITLADIDGWFPFTSYTHGGMLGTTFFATAFLAYTLARRVRVNEALAKQRGIHLYYLVQLNAQIVQNIQSGIIVIDQLGFIRLFNQASQQLLGLKDQPNGLLLITVCPELVEQMTFWQKHGKLDSPIFRPRTGEFDLIPTFTELNSGEVISVLIVLEDAALMTQRAQQLKLASLGRLTASIAHEIRNPLAAISHAGQLLAESPRILEAD
jgi:two-component system sensor histidine kinase PilS (NtrC family)